MFDLSFTFKPNKYPCFYFIYLYVFVFISQRGTAISQKNCDSNLYIYKFWIQNIIAYKVYSFITIINLYWFANYFSNNINYNFKTLIRLGYTYFKHKRQETPDGYRRLTAFKLAF